MASDHRQTTSSLKQEKNNAILKQYQMENTEQDLQHFPYEYEQAIIEYVMKGDYESLPPNFGIPKEYSIGKMAVSALKGLEYGAVALICVIARAAISAGIDPYTAYDINDIYLQKLSTCTAKSEYWDVCYDAFVHYCKEVKKLKLAYSENPYIAKTKFFLSNHLNKPVTISETANYVGITKEYLTYLFRKEEGITPMNYLMNERINAAKNLLKYSEYTQAEIASYLCFCDQSHFCRTYKRIEGITPGQYRKSIRSIERDWLTND